MFQQVELGVRQEIFSVGSERDELQQRENSQQRERPADAREPVGPEKGEESQDQQDPTENGRLVECIYSASPPNKPDKRPSDTEGRKDLRLERAEGRQRPPGGADRVDGLRMKLDSHPGSRLESTLEPQTCRGMLCHVERVRLPVCYGLWPGGL